MNNDQFSFFEEIAEDFFAECDELLSLMRRSLLRIDELKGMEKPEKTLMEDLLRSSHTLKGLSGMAGAHQTMKLTHTLENYLKSVYESNSVISPESLDIMFSAVSMIEQQLSALRQKSEIPDMAGILLKVKNLLPESVIQKIESRNTAHLIREKSGENREIRNEAEYPVNEGEMLWKFIFTPDRTLFEKGININTVRNRLQAAGRVLSSIPNTLEDGSIAFEFIVASREPELLFKGWLADGISYEKIEEKKPEEEISPEVNERPYTAEQIQNEPYGLNMEDSQTKNKFIHKNVVRVDLGRLDAIMQTVGDLVISRSRLNDYLTTPDHEKQQKVSRVLQETNILMERQLRDLRESIMKLRLVPIGEAFERMKFVVRDLIRESGKSIVLEIAGQDSQIDKYIMEKIFDPLLHLVRNAVSHGIETTVERKALGKPDEGKIFLKASAAGAVVVFQVGDDGRGIDRKAVKEKAAAIGILDPDQPFDDTAILNIICSPGFSTSEQTDMVSGRGVGMNVVKKAIRELGGNLSFESESGKGTKFTIQLPLTLSIVEALIVSVGSSVFAIPMPVVNEVVRFLTKDLVRMDNNEMISYRDIVLPVLKLNRFFELDGDDHEAFDSLVVGKGSDRVAIAVDRIIGKREIVVRPIADPLVKVEGISGATELGEGKIVLILDALALVRSAIRKNRIKRNVHI